MMGGGSSMYKNLKLWESKLEYLRDLKGQYEAMDNSWWDLRQWGNYNETMAKLNRKITDYEELIEFLKEASI